jgi:3-phosphoshikimate 1-carboxyvinyltransferase
MTSTTDTVTLSAGGPLHGELVVPGDKSVSHRALMLGAVAKGRTRITGLSPGADVAATAAAVGHLGASVRWTGDAVVVEGNLLQEPMVPLDLGNAGTGMRLMSGLLAGRGLLVVLTGDASLSARPMGRIIDPLSQMGAHIHSRSGRAPLVIAPARLHGIEYAVPVPSAQVKSGILLAGLTAEGGTTVIEHTPTRAYTEEMLADFGADIVAESDRITVRPGELTGRDVQVPADPSQASFWAVGAAIVPGSEVRLPGLDLSPTRTGFIDVLRRMGAQLEVEDGTLQVAYGDRLRATDIEPGEVASLIDEVPILAVAAAAAEGTSTFHGLGELIHKESNRLDGVWRLVKTLGARADIEGESLVIHGISEFLTASVDSRGDHRMTMSAAIAAQLCREPSSLTGARVVDTSYPGFFDDLARLTGEAR